MSQVSCIIPFHNGGETIARAVDSVIHSPHCREVVVVCDASPQPVVSGFTALQLELLRSGKLRVIELATNHGQASARNIGAAISTGAYLSFLDQDDIYLPGFYEHAVPYLEANPHIAALETGAEFYRDGRNVLESPDPRYAAALRSVPWNVLVRRNIFWACGAFPVGDAFRTNLAAEDIPFKSSLRRWFKVAMVTDKFMRHHIREGAATARYLERTEVKDGKIVFKATYSNEEDGSFVQAMNAHLERAAEALKAERAVTFKEN